MNSFVSDQRKEGLTLSRRGLKLVELQQVTKKETNQSSPTCVQSLLIFPSLSPLRSGDSLPNTRPPNLIPKHKSVSPPVRILPLLGGQQGVCSGGGGRTDCRRATLLVPGGFKGLGRGATIDTRMPQTCSDRRATLLPRAAEAKPNTLLLSTFRSEPQTQTDVRRKATCRCSSLGMFQRRDWRPPQTGAVKPGAICRRSPGRSTLAPQLCPAPAPAPRPAKAASVTDSPQRCAAGRWKDPLGAAARGGVAQAAVAPPAPCSVATFLTHASHPLRTRAPASFTALPQLWRSALTHERDSLALRLGPSAIKRAARPLRLRGRPQRGAGGLLRQAREERSFRQPATFPAHPRLWLHSGRRHVPTPAEAPHKCSRHGAVHGF